MYYFLKVLIFTHSLYLIYLAKKVGANSIKTYNIFYKYSLVLCSITLHKNFQEKFIRLTGTTMRNKAAKN